MEPTARLVLLLTVSALLSACGGGAGESDPSAPVPPPSSETPPTGDSPGTPAPGADVLAYQGNLEAALRVVLMMDHAVKVLLPVPADIGPEVNAHGPFTHCTDSTCEDENQGQWYTLVPVAGGSIRVLDWQEVVNANGVLDAPDTLTLDLQDVGSAPAITTTARLYLPGTVDGPFAITFTSNPEQTRGGLTLVTAPSPELQGNLSVWSREGRYEIRDHRPDELMDRQLIVAEYADGQTVSSWLTNSVLRTNVENLSAVDFDIDMLNYIGGARLKLSSLAPLEFGDANGHVTIEAGSYRYEYQDDARGRHFVLRVSVDADPAYLLIEMDSEADGTFENSGRIVQSALDYLPQ